MKKIVFVLLIMVFGLLALVAYSKIQTDINEFEMSEPSKEQIASLEKIYNGFSSFRYAKDTGFFEWSGVSKEQFDALCGEGVNTTWESTKIHIDKFQTPSETINRKIGDCEDFAVLFVGAARNLGISARACGGHYTSYNREIEGRHAWVEIYYNKRWRVIDPTSLVSSNGTNPIDTPAGTPFRTCLTEPPKDSYQPIFFFNEKRVVGEWLSSSEIEENVANEESFKFNDLIKAFKIVTGRDPSASDQEEIRKIARSVAEEVVNLTLAAIPEDFTILIQPDDPVLKAWMEQLNVRAN